MSATYPAIEAAADKLIAKAARQFRAARNRTVQEAKLDAYGECAVILGLAMTPFHFAQAIREMVAEHPLDIHPGDGRTTAAQKRDVWETAIVTATHRRLKGTRDDF